jgi:capsular polysaccharide biosynthesis protein
MRKTFIPVKVAKRKKTRRIFIKRGRNIRGLKNEDKIIDVLRQIGFEIIEPEKLSFQGQIEIFSNANVIVGASGAALANLIFSPAEAKIVILAAANPLLKYGYWQNLVQTFGGQISYILGHPESSHIHSAFTINMQTLKKEISKCFA